MSGVAFSPDGTVVATGDAGGGSYLSDPAGRWLVTLADPAATSVLAVAFSPDGSTLAAGDASGRAYLWSWTHRRGIARQLPVVLEPGGS